MLFCFVGDLQVEGVGGKRISPAAALHGVPPLEAFEPVEHPAEPKEIDKPVQCPPQENSIMQVFDLSAAPDTSTHVYVCMYVWIDR